LNKKARDGKRERENCVISSRETFERLCPKNGEKSKCPSVDNGNGDKFMDEEYSLDELN
jgi:hypothetical protein